MVDHERTVASTTNGTFEAEEDAVGLRAHGVVTDTEVIEAARAGKLKGWSFNMYQVHDEIEERAGKLPLRKVKDFLMSEITLVINKLPVYSSTSIEVRAEGEQEIERRAELVDIEVIDNATKPLDYSFYENRIPKK